jgi:hypothetical protein
VLALVAAAAAAVVVVVVGNRGQKAEAKDAGNTTR